MLSASGVFLRLVELDVGGVLLDKRASLSLYQVTADRDTARRLVAGYHKSGKQRTGAALVGVLMPHVGGSLHGHLDDVSSAMQTLDGVSDDDAKLAADVLLAVVISFLLLHLVMVGLALGEAVRGSYRRGRVIVTLVISAVVTAMAIGIYLVAHEAVWQANDELGHPLFELSVGAYVMPLASIVGLVASIALVVQHHRVGVTARTRPASRSA